MTDFLLQMPLPSRAQTPSKASRKKEAARHTNNSRDWEIAADLQLRSERRETLKMHRNRSWSGFVDTPAATKGPFLRGPMLDKMKARLPNDGWCELYARKAFAEYDTSRLGEVSMQNLHESLQGAELPLDPCTFNQYMDKTGMPKGDAVAQTDFVNFHRAIWENQPPAVKRQHVTLRGQGAMAASMPRCQTAPAAVSVKEIREGERVARRAFGRHVPPAEDGGGRLGTGVLPNVLSDLGLYAETTAESVQATGDGCKKLGFEDFVGVLNQHMFVAEGWRDIAAPPTDVPSRTRRLLEEARSFAASGQAESWPDMLQDAVEGASEKVQDDGPGQAPAGEGAGEGGESGSAAEQELFQSLKGRARSALAAAFAGSDSRPSSPLAPPAEAEAEAVVDEDQLQKPAAPDGTGSVELTTAVVSLAFEGAARLSLSAGQS
mmetsp:Transcript_52072/g.123985  ORF Transcript_52072/g.123985 Transcript_52072/m.123985 type:complete len:434 (+) Transcript_52072:86-1387(+)